MAINLTLKQTDAILSRARYKVLNWGRRSGKTTEFGQEALGTGLTVPDAKITYIAQTRDDARAIAWEIFLETFKPLIIGRPNQTLLEFTFRNRTSGFGTMRLRGWEAIVNAQKGRGTENDLLLCDEVAFCRGFQKRFDEVLDPTLLTTKGRAVFGSTPNGFNDFYYLAQQAQLNPNNEWFYSHATAYDNPANDPAEIDKKRLTLSSDRFAQEYMADFRKQEGLVYKEFSRELHLFSGEIPNTVLLKIGSVDWGYRHKGVVLTVYRDTQRHYWVRKEFSETERTETQLAEIAAAENFNKCYPDPENQSGIAELKKRGVNVMDVVKGSGSIISGIDKVRTLLRERRLHIHVSCVCTTWGFETYHYPLSGFTDLPQKEDDDEMDALRYIILMDEPDQADFAPRRPIRIAQPRINPAF